LDRPDHPHGRHPAPRPQQGGRQRRDHRLA
jgi:hypothetical protein